MKKTTLLIAALLILPLLVVMVAVGPSGVTVFDGETTRMISWFQMVPESNWGWCAPVAGLMNYVLFVLAVVYALKKKVWCIKGIRGISFAALCLAALPIVIQTEIKIIPNVLGLIFLTAEFFVAQMILKKQDAVKETKPKGKRLDRI